MVDLLPSGIGRYDSGVYSLALTFPGATAIDAVHRMSNGSWLFSVDAPADFGGTPVEREDVVLFDGLAYTLYFDGSAVGVPATSDVDALFLDDITGDVVLSFDETTSIGQGTFEPADLVRFDTASMSFLLFFDASAATPPIPSGTNVIGADRRGSLLVLTFDVPTTLGATTYLPGQLVAWDGSGFALFHTDPAWPVSSQLNAFAFLPAPGEASGLMVAHTGDPSRVRLSWNASCSAGAEGYGIYIGQIGSWYSHQLADCSDDGGDLMEEVATGPGNYYFLVVPRNDDDEGSYGFDSALVPLPPGGGAGGTCAPGQVIAPCP